MDASPTSQHVNALRPNDFRLITLGRIALLSPRGDADDALNKRRLKLALLVVLALSKRPLSRDFLVGMFWGEQEEERARHSLSDALSHLRRVLGRDAIVVRQADVALTEEARLSVDAVEFAAAVGAGEHERAIALYAGPFLDAVYVAGSRSFDDWASRERARLEALFVRACQAQCMALARGRRWAECAALAERWLEAAPLSTDAALYVLNALKAPGTRDADQRALAEYERLAARLGRDYERAPDRAVAALARDIAERLAAGDATGEFRAPAPAAVEGREAERDARPADQTPVAEVQQVAAPPTSSGPAPPESLGGALVPPAATAGRAEIDEPPSRRRWRGGLVAGGVAGIGVVAAAVLLTSQMRAPALGAQRVVVAPFDNATHDPALDPLGRLAAEYVREGLAQVGSLEVAGYDAPRDGGPRAVADAAALQRVAERARAATVVAGSYYAVGDSLEFREQLVDGRTRDVLATVGPLRAGRANVRPALEEMRQRTAGALALLNDPLGGRWAMPAGQPPTHEAYKELAAGLALFFGERPASKGDAGVDEVTARLARAAALDTTFLQPRLWLAWYHTVWFFKGATADTLLRPLEEERDRLSPFESALVDGVRTSISGDVVAGVNAWRRVAAATPLPYFKLRYVRALLAANRPREALRVAHETRPGSGDDATLYWETIGQIHHYLGDHDEELAAARSARQLAPQSLPGLLAEVYALAAAGRVADLEARVQEAPSLPYDPRDGLRVGDVLTMAALELRAHGHAAEAARFLDRAVAWYDARPPTEPDDAYEYAARYAAGQWQEAGRLAERALAGDVRNIFLQGLVGRAAARRGDRATAERVSADLAVPDRLGLRAYRTFERAKIAAVLGDQQRAVALVVDAFNQGLGWQGRSALHREVDLEPLRSDPAFRRLLAPQG